MLGREASPSQASTAPCFTSDCKMERKQGRRRRDNIACFLASGIFQTLFPFQLWEAVAPAKRTGAASEVSLCWCQSPHPVPCPGQNRSEQHCRQIRRGGCVCVSMGGDGMGGAAEMPAGSCSLEKQNWCQKKEWGEKMPRLLGRWQ